MKSTSTLHLTPCAVFNLRIFIAAIMLVPAFFLSACKQNEKAAGATTQFVAMGTAISITVHSPSAEMSENALSIAQSEITRLEKLWSTTDSESEIFALNTSLDSVNVSEETAKLLLFAKEMAEQTDGAFDPTIYPLVDAWGFLTHQYRIPSNDEIASLLSRTGSEKILLEENDVSLLDGAQVDLGGIAKGVAGDSFASIMRENGITSAIINLGGNVQLVGARPDGEPWRIGIRNPFGTGILGFAAVQNCAVITSGSYERNFLGGDGLVYHHIIDPETGYPAENGLISVTIITEEGSLADALSTGLFVMGTEKAITFWRERGGFETILVTEENSVLISEGIAASFTLSDEYLASARVITKDTEYFPLWTEFSATAAAE